MMMMMMMMMMMGIAPGWEEPYFDGFEWQRCFVVEGPHGERRVTFYGPLRL